LGCPVIDVDDADCDFGLRRELTVTHGHLLQR
jgi:hypothetical protein